MQPDKQKPLLRVFLSSPGDVALERSLTGRVFRELAGDPFYGELSIEVVSWNDPASPTPMLATLTPQEAVNRFGYKPSQCDVVIVILWSRIGAHLSIEKFKRPSGDPYLSGTEWEYEDAVNADPPPEVLVYRRTEQPVIKLSDPDVFDNKRQYDLVEQFFKRFQNDDGSFRGGYNTYETPEDFQKILTSNIKHIISARLRNIRSRSNEEEEVGYSFGIAGRLPPSNLQAEQALLGALLANNRAYERVSEYLSPIHFADPIHGRIYQSIARRIDSGELADAITLKKEFENSGILDEVGGTAYLVQLLSAMVGIINAAEYGRAIHDSWLRRQLINIGETIVNNAFSTDPELDGNAQVELAEQSLSQLTSDGGDGRRGPISFEVALSEAIKGAERAFHQTGHVSGLTTGLRDLDTKLDGMHPSELLILAGRPSMGKSALATRIAFGAAKSLRGQVMVEGPNAPPKRQVAIFSLELSTDEIATRLLTEESRVSVDCFRRGDIGQSDFDRIVAATREIGSLPLQIDGTPAISMSMLRTRCRRLQRTMGLAFVVVDYLQLMRPSAESRLETRALELSQITQGLKALAKELGIAVLAVLQLPQQVENREDNRPQLSDLVEFGSIEQDADVVMFIHRDECYVERRMPKAEAVKGGPDKFNAAMDEWARKMAQVHDKADLIVAKQRRGPTGSVQLYFDAASGRFADRDPVP